MINFKIRRGIRLLAAALLCTLSLQEEALRLMAGEFTVDIPILKYGFALLEHVQGWGLDNIVLLLGIFLLLYHTGQETELQGNRYLSVLALLFGIFTVFGRSYSDLGSWDYIFCSKTQFIAALLIVLGYYLLYKNVVILGSMLWRRLHVRKGRITGFVFEKHPYGMPLVIFVLAGLPYLICFFPGTVDWDAISQLATYESLGGQRLIIHWSVLC